MSTAVMLPRNTEEWKRLRRYLKQRAYMRVRRCPYCWRLMARYSETLDHIRPKCRGGTNSCRNTAVVCSECNSRKADRTPFQLMLWALRIVVVACIFRLKWWP